ncbi:MAG: GNAT family N-acetyltransferase, partial [Actinobacteria bacterium]|nr:GNAT family N-acetyltransferase [Actinomycetota bacterium]
MDINNKVEMLEKPEEQDLMDISSLLNQLDPTIVTPPNKKMIDAVESSNNHILIIRNQENRVIAMLTMITYPVLEGYSKAWIEDVIVDIKERGKGMGEALVLKA